MVEPELADQQVLPFVEGQTMQNRPNAAERLRPFIHAMEQSIDQARSRRVVGGRPVGPAPAGREAPRSEHAPVQPAVEPLRMKARPKRDFARP